MKVSINVFYTKNGDLYMNIIINSPGLGMKNPVEYRKLFNQAVLYSPNEGQSSPNVGCDNKFLKFLSIFVVLIYKELKMKKIFVLGCLTFTFSFSYAEEKCDPATIGAGVDLRAAYVKARDALPQHKAYDEARAAYDEARAALRKAYDEAWAAYDEARVAYGEAGAAYYEARGVALPQRKAYDEARAALPQRKAYFEARAAYYEARVAYDEAGAAYNEAGAALPQHKAFYEAEDAYEEARAALPEWRKYEEFMEVNHECGWKIGGTFDARQKKLSETRFYSGPGQSPATGSGKTKEAGGRESVQ